MTGHYKGRHRRPTHYHRKRGAFENLPELLAVEDETFNGTRFLSGDEVLRLIDPHSTHAHRPAITSTAPFDRSDEKDGLDD